MRLKSGDAMDSLCFLTRDPGADAGQVQQLTVAKHSPAAMRPSPRRSPHIWPLACCAVRSCLVGAEASAVKGWFSSRHDHRGPLGSRACNCTVRIPWNGSRRRGPSLSTNWISRPPIGMRSWRCWRQAAIQDPPFGLLRSHWLEALHWGGLVLGTVLQPSRLSTKLRA